MQETKAKSQFQLLIERLGFADYAAYLKSPLWAAIRRLVFVVKGRKCCKCNGDATQVHHEKYDEETMRGLSIVRLHPICRDCHDFASMTSEGEKISLPQTNRILGLGGSTKPTARPAVYRTHNRSGRPLCECCHKNPTKRNQTLCGACKRKSVVAKQGAPVFDGRALQLARRDAAIRNQKAEAKRLG